MTTPTRLIILNPTSRLGHSAEEAPAIRTALLSPGSEMVLTEYPGHARELAASARGFDMVVIAGGDGTVHEVANGIMEIPEESRPTLAIVPTGSGNDTCRTVGIPLDIPQAIDLVLHGVERQFDLGICNGVYFTNSMSVGLDAVVSLKAEEYKSKLKLSGTPLYAITALDVIFIEMRPFRLTISIDGGAPTTGEYLICAVTNGKTYGSGMVVNPNAVADDRLLTVATVPVVGKLKTLGMFIKLLTGKIETVPEYSWRHVESIVIDVEGDPVPRATDGEVTMDTHFDVRVVPGALRVIAPC